MKIKPAKNIVVCEDTEVTNEAGIMMASTDKKNKPEIGKVLFIGKGVPPIKIKVGDKIVYAKYTDNRIEVGGKKYNFIEFKNIFAVI